MIAGIQAVRSMNASGGREEQPRCLPTEAVPLPLLGASAKGEVLRVRGGDDLRRHLKTLGFVEGAEVLVSSEAAGDAIIEVKGCRVALDRKAASKIIVRPLL